jgi:hypothetical protein
MKCINRGLEELRGELLLFWVRETLRSKYCAFLYYVSSVGCEDQPYSWVHREGRKREERERKDL